MRRGGFVRVFLMGLFEGFSYLYSRDAEVRRVL